MFAYNEWQSDWRQILNINGNCAKKNHGCRVQFLKELGGPSSKIVAKKKYNDLSFSIPFYPPGWNWRTRNLPSVSSLSIYMLRDWKKKMLWLTSASQINIIFKIDCFPDYLCYFWYDRGSISSMFCSEETAPPPFFTLKALAGYHPVGKPQIGSLFVNFSAFLPAGTS